MALERLLILLRQGLFWIAQNPNSETVSLLIGVGAAGKDSLATWINSHGEKCTVRQLSQTYGDASYDLLIHTGWWLGTSGTRSARAFLYDNGQKIYNGDYYKFEAPAWVNSKNFPADAKIAFDKDAELEPTLVKEVK